MKLLGMDNTLSSNSFSWLRDMIGRGQYQNMKATAGTLHKYGLDPENTLNDKELDLRARMQANAALPGNLNNRQTNALANHLAGSDIVTSNANLALNLSEVSGYLKRIVDDKLNIDPSFKKAQEDYRAEEAKKEPLKKESEKLSADLLALTTAISSAARDIAAGGHTEVGGDIKFNVEIKGTDILTPEIIKNITDAATKAVKDDLANNPKTVP